jgi:hypothetical protein
MPHANVEINLWELGEARGPRQRAKVNMKMVLFGIVALGVWAVGSHALLDWGRATGHLGLAIGILIGLAMALGLWWWRARHE